METEFAGLIPSGALPLYL
uniref:Uncharacterized protein n=1 Tax=Anguilla anguilla TaxID=7936 RepID=A0A0E9PWT9_ANGAN